MNNIKPRKKVWVEFLNKNCLRTFDTYEEAVKFQNNLVNNWDFSAKVI